MFPNKIVKYIVRIPGYAMWSKHSTEQSALRECAKVNRTIQPGHKVFAQHENGDVTGPYNNQRRTTHA